MSDVNALEALQTLHGELVAACEHRLENSQLLIYSLNAHAPQFKKLLDKQPRKKESRDAVQAGSSPLQDGSLSYRLIMVHDR